MTRRKISRQELAARELDKITTAKSIRDRSTITATQINREIANIDKRIKNEDWETVKPVELVALYAWCHNELYGVMPTEMIPRVWQSAKAAAKRMVKNEFNNNIEKAIGYFRWVWSRERGKVEWRIDKGIDISRITWKNMFIHKYLITDYRTAEMVHAKKNYR